MLRNLDVVEVAVQVVVVVVVVVLVYVAEVELQVLVLVEVVVSQVVIVWKVAADFEESKISKWQRFTKLSTVFEKFRFKINIGAYALVNIATTAIA